MTGGKKLFGKQEAEPVKQPRQFTKPSKLPNKIELLRHAFRQLDSLIIKTPEEQ